ncbi:MAG: high frequency lysogenization protein HflD [Kangiellaceae bacterium]|jgi:high frequency lysogenization protein|nr:high frequency lysogenization protein HflD [Kangiellaceae bacterium]
MNEIVLALAAIAQAVKQVQQLAWKGDYDEADSLPLLESVFKVNADSVAEIYSGSASLTTGLRLLRTQLDNGTTKDPELSRYLANIFTIEKQFSTHQEVQDIVSSRLEHTKRLLEFDEVTSSNVINSLAESYSQSISTLPMRLQVHGDPTILTNKLTQSKIRALLLTAVRSAVLWRQVGGKKRQFIFSRQKLLNACQQLLTQPIY